MQHQLCGAILVEQARWKRKRSLHRCLPPWITIIPDELVLMCMGFCVSLWEDALQLRLVNRRFASLVRESSVVSNGLLVAPDTALAMKSISNVSSHWTACDVRCAFSPTCPTIRTFAGSLKKITIRGGYVNMEALRPLLSAHILTDLFLFSPGDLAEIHCRELMTGLPLERLRWPISKNPVAISYLPTSLIELQLLDTSNLTDMPMLPNLRSITTTVLLPGDLTSLAQKTLQLKHILFAMAPSSEIYVFLGFPALERLGISELQSPIIIPATVTELFLSYCRSGAQLQLQNPLKLKKVSVFQNKGAPLIDTICTMSNLHTLSLDCLMFLDQSRIDCLGNLLKLKTVSLEVNGLDLQPLAAVEDLTLTYLHANCIAFLYQVMGMKKLRRLKIDDSEAEHALIHTFVRGVPDLAILDLIRCPNIDANNLRYSFPNLCVNYSLD
jgi:hypothetical protein